VCADLKIAGLVDLMDHVSKWRRNPTTYSPEEMKACLDQLSSVLFKHLDQEVRFACLSDGIILINSGGGHQRRQPEAIFQTGGNREHRQIREDAPGKRSLFEHCFNTKYVGVETGYSFV
jgi:hypothetical protein